jgi:hypothetical protein
MTNGEAKYKWCRHVRRLEWHRYGDGAGAASTNRTERDNNRCIGSECASWDWWDEEKLGSERRGYCGADRIKPNRVGNNG